MPKENTNTHLAIVGLSFMAVGASLALFFSGQFTASDEAANNERANQPEQEQNLEVQAVSADDDAMLGDADAPVQIVEFSDYQCPYCAKFVKDTMPQIIEEYVDKGLVSFVFRDFPLGSHQEAVPAAIAAECVGEFGDEEYFKMHDMIFERAADWNRNPAASEMFVEMAAELGHDISGCMDSEEIREEVSADFAAARGYGVTGTPTLFINGKKIVGAYPFEVFQSLIDEELKNQ